MVDELSTLLDYIIASDQYDKNDTLFDTHYSTLINTFIIENEKQYTNIEIENPSRVNSKYHVEIIEKILSADYFTKANERVFIKQLLCSAFWLFVHHKLGTMGFVSLFQSYSIFEYQANSQNFLKVYGPPITLHTYLNKKKKHSVVYKKISIQSWLSNKTIQTYHNYKMIVSFKELQAFLDAEDLKTIKDNHDYHIKYTELIKTMCLTQAEKNLEIPNTLNSIIDKKNIMNYIKLATNKLLNGLFDKNTLNLLKPFIFKNVNIILHHSNNQFTSLSDLKDDLLLALNKRKFCLNKQAIVKFINWLFVYYYPSLMKYSFFGLTFTSKEDIIFYKHLDAHSFISTKIDHFIKNHFDVYSGCERQNSKNKTNIVHDLSNGYYHCNIKPVLKDLKKINNFRFLSVPDKITTFNSYSRHITFNMKYVKPTNKILTHLRYKVLPAIYERRHPTKKKNILVQNISEVMLHYSNFVNENKYRTLNKHRDLFYLKFDIKNSYDSVPLNLLNTILTNIFKEVGLDKEFKLSQEDSIHFSQVVNTSNKRIIEFKPLCKINVDRELETQEVKRQKKNNFIKEISVPKSIKITQNISDNDSITIKDVKEITKKEIFETITAISNKCYKRTNGLAQGMYLSPILSNIFYDDMIHSTPTLLFPKDHNSFFIRFMDDFLLISEDYMILKSMKQKLMNNQMFDKRFEVFVNLQKLEICKKKNETFEFIGLEFDLAERSIRKKVEKSMHVINYSHITTFKGIYNKLIAILEIRLNADYTMQLDMNSIEVIQQQVLLICDNIFTMFIGFLKNIRHDKVIKTEPKHFYKFVFNILNLVCCHIDKMNKFEYFSEKKFYRLRQLVDSLDNLIALQFILNLKHVNSNKSTKFIEVLQKMIHS
mgnify:CR=1 FL=1